MTERAAKALVSVSLALVIVLTAIGLVVLVLGWNASRPETLFGFAGYGLGLGVVFAATGALLASRRPENPIGWVILGAGVISAVQGLGETYALWILIGRAERTGLAILGAWLDEWVWIGPVASLGVLAAIYPDGRWLSRGWRRAIIFSMALTAVAILATALSPELVLFEGFDNPTGITGMTTDEYYRVFGWATGLFLAPVIVGTLSAITRFRRSVGDERQQLKWLALSAGLIALALVAYTVAYVLSTGVFTVTSGGSGGLDVLEIAIVVSFLTVPVAIAIGVLKYRLYDIDLVLSKALIYGSLAVIITLIYVALVVGVGAALHDRGHVALSALAAALVALIFQPVRRRAQRLANRLVYGKRASPYEVLAEFSGRLGASYSVEDVLPRMARVLQEAIGAERVIVWLRTGERFVAAGTWPPPDEPLDSRHDVPPSAFEVRHQGELLGAIALDMPRDEPLAGASERLVADAATQAGLVLRNVRLTEELKRTIEELRASRQRIVSAQDERARKLERDIHDGAQQQLVALSVKLGLLGQLADRDPGTASTLLVELQTDATDALENLRDLARGIYPPLLADEGLEAALRAQARKSPVQPTVDATGLQRYPQEVEAAVYFCTLEALQNAAKYADATSVGVHLEHHDGNLRFKVADDGRGFEPAEARGAGLTNMRDRLEALGGSIEVRSAPGAGTTIAGRVPVGVASYVSVQQRS